MFNKRNTNNVENEMNQSNNIIGKGTTFKGDIDSTGNLRIEGKVIGNIKCKAKVVLGPTAIVEGDLFSANAEVGGTVNGRIRTSELLVLNPSALVNGDLFSGNLIIESGAKFTGRCKMGISATQIDIEGKREDEIKTDHNIKAA